jgi:TolA-binding protein
MKVVDLHPEELIDKLSLGEAELTSAERQRLDAHLAQCSACRFEVGVRADLERETPVFDERPQLNFPSVTERARPERLAARKAASVRPRSRRRRPLVMLAAALVLCAGGATAAVITGAVRARWLPWVAQPNSGVSSASPLGEAGATAKRGAQKGSSSVKALPAVSADAVPLPPSIAPPASADATLPVSTPVAIPASRTTPALPRASSARLSATPASPNSAPLPETSSPRADGGAPRVDPAAALFADANRARRDGNADRAMSLYRSLQSRYPSSSESELSRALLAQLQLDRGSPEAALAGFDRYLADGSRALGAEALVGRARALEQLGKTAQAAAAWREVQSRFSGSVHARLAATRLAALGMR